jgi:hypothetical protein
MKAITRATAPALLLLVACTTSSSDTETDFVSTCRNAATEADQGQILPPDVAVEVIRDANADAGYIMTSEDIADCHQGINDARGGCTYRPNSFGTDEYAEYVDCVAANR